MKLFDWLFARYNWYREEVGGVWCQIKIVVIVGGDKTYTSTSYKWVRENEKKDHSVIKTETYVDWPIR